MESINFILGNAEEHLKKPLETLSLEDLKKYFEGLKEKGLKPNTIGIHQQKFIQFYDWCFEETDHEKYNTLSRKIKRFKVNRVKTPLNPNEILLPDEIKKLINVANIERDRCIVATFYESGMRLGEFLALDTDMVQMDEQKQEVTFHIPNEQGCKTGARSVVCLEIFGYVQDWLKCNSSKKFMLMKPSGVRDSVKRLFKTAGINKPCNIHHFRHSAITHAAGLNMSETQLSYRFWGIPHSNMLSVYIHLNEQLKSSGYRDAKGMGESNGNTIINPLASRCVDCGKLIQSGSLCPVCTKTHALAEQNVRQGHDLETLQQEMAKRDAEIAKMKADWAIVFDFMELERKRAVAQGARDEEARQDRIEAALKTKAKEWTPPVDLE